MQTAEALLNQSLTTASGNTCTVIGLVGDAGITTRWHHEPTVEDTAEVDKWFSAFIDGDTVAPGRMYSESQLNAMVFRGSVIAIAGFWSRINQVPAGELRDAAVKGMFGQMIAIYGGRELFIAEVARVNEVNPDHLIDLSWVL